MRIVFFGTPHFAQTILAYLIEQGVDIACVVSRPDKPKGRSKKLIPTPVKELALSKNLPVHQPSFASDPEFANFLASLKADLFVVAAYAEILKENILSIPRLGCVNVHASVLPKYRGAAPIQRSIMAGEKQSGVTIMKMALKMDAGDILAISKTEISSDMTAGELTAVLADLGKVALFEVMQGLEKGTIEPHHQDPSQVTFAKKLLLADGQINWMQTCQEVHNQIRGVTPKPGAWCWVQVNGEKKRFLVKKAAPEFSYAGNPASIVSKDPLELVVACGSGAIRLLQVQLEGKKTLSAEAFLRGIALPNLTFL